MMVKKRFPPRSQTPKPSFVPRLRLFPFIPIPPSDDADYGGRPGEVSTKGSYAATSAD